MRNRVLYVFVLVMIVVLVNAAAVSADSPGKLVGSMNMEPPDWGDYFRIWASFEVHQVDPVTYEAKGTIEGRVYNSTLGLKRIWYQAKCVRFLEVDGKPAAILVGQIVRREGWDVVPTAGEPGEYFRWQIVDGGTPAGKGDVWRLQYYDYGNFVEYWPTYPTGGCSVFLGDETNYADYGNLVVDY